MSDSKPVSLDLQDSVAHVLINQETSLNALSVDVLEGLLRTAEEIEQLCRGEAAYQTCRLVQIRGAGERSFAAGADIKLMSRAAPDEIREFVKLGQATMRAFERLPLPVIAVVQGFALGGGMELALACDLILASEQARFGQPEVNLGLIPGFGGTQRLSARCGTGAARRLILTGETISAREALALGAVDWVVPAEELQSKAQEISATLKAKAPLALSAAKRAIGGFNPQLEAGLQQELEEFVKVIQTADAKLGLQAFLTKQQANFTGR